MAMLWSTQPLNGTWKQGILMTSGSILSGGSYPTCYGQYNHDYPTFDHQLPYLD